MTESIFINYWDEVVSLLRGKPSRSQAISLSEKPPAQFDGTVAVDRLYQTLACDGWNSPSGKNWHWRTAAPAYQTTSPEVALEREIIAADSSQWTCQMSTASGIQGPHLNKRRAVDLVIQLGPDQYAFIELKVDSDNPLYAAFEILGYALAYQHSRQHGWRGTGRHDVMCAQAINLVVLGPHEWYEYRKRGDAQRNRFELGWLANALDDGLNSLSAIPRMHFSFEEFTDLGDPKLTAAGIVRDAQWRNVAK